MTGTVEISRFSCIECPHMLRVSDSAGPTRDSLVCASCRIAFPHVVQGRHPKLVISELNGWPALPPVNASRASSRLPAHDSGPQWSSFSFHVGLFHPLLYAGLSRRFHNVPLIPNRPSSTCSRFIELSWHSIYPAPSIKPFPIAVQ